MTVKGDTLLSELRGSLEGDFFTDWTLRTLYATDASTYRELPRAVAIPKSEEDLKKLIFFAKQNDLSLIPRTAGTSLAGQVVGAGIVVDVSKYFTQILEINEHEQWVRVQPGVVRDELNRVLQPYNLFFAPETSTANRAMIGGMVGNNSCGSNSLIYKSTREHVLEIEALLSDGSKVCFRELSFDAFINKCEQNDLEGQLYKQIRSLLGDSQNQQEIRQQFPKAEVERRNTGYAIDVLLESDPFTAGAERFNFAKLICGSEGTLAFITSIKLHLSELPKNPSGLLCIHFNTIEEALKANLIALAHNPKVSELMDAYILSCTKNNLEQSKNRFFVQGDPGAILIVEYDGISEDEIREKVAKVETHMRSEGYGYYFPLVLGNKKKKVWDLRKAGLGLLSNTPGDAKPVAVIEDTAVAVEDLPAYISEFNEILKRYNLYAVHYAHAATGELHLRPIINLKTESGNLLFKQIASEIATLVKKYRGSLSGEHGDGRLRGEFIAQMIGEHNYGLLKQIKDVWDPNKVFNPGKIVDTPSMNTFLRYEPGVLPSVSKSTFRYGQQTMLQHAEQCNGSGDCRKSQLAGGTMCPSYMVTHNEKDTTRARANILREFLTKSAAENRFGDPEVKEVLDLCISCKGCKSECPSSVDMTKLKADFMQNYYDTHGLPLRTRLVGWVAKVNQFASYISGIYNWTVQNKITAPLVKKCVGFSQHRELPTVAHWSLRKWFTRHDKPLFPDQSKKGSVYFFCDEFTNFNDVEIGKKAILLLEQLGYEVRIIDHAFSGRALLSKGMLRAARKLANRNVEVFDSRITADSPLLSVEPSAILCFRDEYVDLVDEHLISAAERIAPHALLMEEFLWREFEKGNISASNFESTTKSLLLHTHCQQKAWKLEHFSEKALSIPHNYHVKSIPSGCCGMAGSFGLEREHYDISMQIGELVLFPVIRKKLIEEVIVATGLSCRHQIKDGTTERAYHPIEILYNALIKR